VIAEDTDAGDLHGAGDLARQRPGFIGVPVVGEVTAKDQNVGCFRDLGEQRLERSLDGVFAMMEVTERRDPDGVLGRLRHIGQLQQTAFRSAG
jgi:hypothetical protein